MAYLFAVLALGSLVHSQSTTSQCSHHYVVPYPDGTELGNLPYVPDVVGSVVTADLSSTVIGIGCPTPTDGSTPSACGQGISSPYPTITMSRVMENMQMEISADDFTFTAGCELHWRNPLAESMICEESASGSLTDFTGVRTATYEHGRVALCITAGYEKIKEVDDSLATATGNTTAPANTGSVATTALASPASPPEFTGAATANVVMTAQGLFAAGVGLLAGWIL